MKRRISILRFLLVICCPLLVSTISNATTHVTEEKHAGTPIEITTIQVNEQYPFYGLAAYLNGQRVVYIDEQYNIENVDDNHAITTNTVAILGRYKGVVFSGNAMRLEKNLLRSSDNFISEYRGSKHSLSQKLNQINFSYSHLWTPLQWLCLAIEELLRLLLNFLTQSGWAVVLLALIVKILMSPLSIAGHNAQKRTEKLSSILNPKLTEIKKHYDGEEAHNRIMAAFKEQGVSPFYTMRPVLYTILQLPVLIAIFNVLGEMPDLNGISMLWVNNIAYPDAFSELPFAIPFMGNTLNLFPILMLGVSLLALPGTANKQKAVLVSLALFFLFYPFPAAMVLYWTSATLIQIIIQKLQDNRSNNLA